MEILRALSAFFLVAAVTTAPVANAAELRDKATAVFQSIEQIFEVEIEPWGVSLCPREDYCAVEAMGTQVSVYGQGIVEVLTSSGLAHEDYMTLCAAAYSGLSGVRPEAAAGAIGVAFGSAAAQGGRFSTWFDDTQIQISDDLDGRPSCRFFHK